MFKEQQIKFQPTQKSSRINSLDVIRGIALLGILLMNINGMGLPFSYGDPTIAGGAEGLNLDVWITNNMLFEGTMRGLFTLLFGAGVILLTSRLEKDGAGITTADIYYRRLLWLLLFGVLHAYVLLWEGEILYPYALFGLLLFPLRNTRPKYLIAGGLALICFGILWDVLDYRENLNLKIEAQTAETIKIQGDSLTSQQQKAIDSWEKKTTKKTKEEVAEYTAEMHGNYWTVAKTKVSDNQFMQTWITYRYWPWDLLPFMLLGMAFFKLRIFHGERSKLFYIIMMFTGYLIGLGVNYYETKLVIDANFDVLSMANAGQTYGIGRLFTTLGHVGFFMLFIKSGILGFLQKSLAAVGRMALTNYLMHSIIAAFVFYGFGFSLFNKLQRFELYYVVGGIWLFQLIASPIWFNYFRYGPAEWFWRSLTYKKRQPFKL